MINHGNSKCTFENNHAGSSQNTENPHNSLIWPDRSVAKVVSAVSNLEDLDEIDHYSFMEVCYDIGIDPTDLYKTMLSDSDRDKGNQENSNHECDDIDSNFSCGGIINTLLEQRH